MAPNLRTALIATAGGTCISLASAALASMPHLENVGVLLLPGILVSALFFSTGIHSGYPIIFMILAGVANIAIYGCLIALIYNALRQNNT